MARIERAIEIYKKFFSSERKCDRCKMTFIPDNIVYTVIVMDDNKNNEKRFKVASVASCPYCGRTAIKWSLPMNQENAYILKGKLENSEGNIYTFINKFLN